MTVVNLDHATSSPSLSSLILQLPMASSCTAFLCLRGMEKRMMVVPKSQLKKKNHSSELLIRFQYKAHITSHTASNILHYIPTYRPLACEDGKKGKIENLALR